MSGAFKLDHLEPFKHLRFWVEMHPPLSIPQWLKLRPIRAPNLRTRLRRCDLPFAADVSNGKTHPTAISDNRSKHDISL